MTTVMVEARFKWKHQRDMRDVADRLDDLQSEVGNSLENAAEEIGLRIQARAARKAPVETGHLRSSISSEAEKVTKHTVKAIVGSNVDYAPHQEVSQPYLRPAIEAEEENIKRIVKEALEEAADEAR